MGAGKENPHGTERVWGKAETSNSRQVMEGRGHQEGYMGQQAIMHPGREQLGNPGTNKITGITKNFGQETN